MLCRFILGYLIPRGFDSRRLHQQNNTGFSPVFCFVGKKPNYIYYDVKGRGGIIVCYMSRNNIHTVDDWFNECYECYADSIFRFCLVKTSSREVALDLAQETFTRLWDMIRDNKEIEHPRALLYTIARNAITDYYRKKKSDSLESLVDTGHEPSVPARAETDAEYEHVLSAIQKLEEPYKEVVYLRYVEELPPRDIAIALGEPVNVISIRITRGMKKLRAALG